MREIDYNYNDLLEMTEEQVLDIASIGGVMETLGGLFTDGEGTPQGLRMAIAAIRSAADALEEVCDTWEYNIARYDEHLNGEDRE